MKNLFIPTVIFTLLLTNCSAQVKTDKRKIYNKDFKWTITIPAGFDTVSTEEWSRLQNRGTDAIEKTYDAEIENHAKSICVFRNDKFNYFESNYQPFDTTVDGNYLESFNEVNKMTYGTFEEQMKGTQLDSSSSTAVIGGLTFHTFKVVIKFPNNMEMNWLMYSRLFGKREFTVNIATVDRQKEKELLDSWLNSTFDR
jgi:hypothetical protein